MWFNIKEKQPECLGNYLVTVEMDTGFCFVCIDHYNGMGNWTTYNTKKKGTIIAWDNIPDAYEVYDR